MNSWSISAIWASMRTRSIRRGNDVFSKAYFLQR
jgi:hypothetical protein